MLIKAQENETLLALLAKLAPDSSKTTLRSWIKEGRVTVDDEVVKRNDCMVHIGQQVAVLNKKAYVEHKLHILFEDDHLVAIDKPTGILSVATAFEKQETAHGLLKKHYHPRRVQIVHRIDQDTSGVMLFALSDKGYKGLKALFEAHDIERAYCAIVEGKLTPSQGTWQSYVYEDPNYIVHSSPNPEDGSLAITHYKVISSSPHYSRLLLTLETGRKNQIRVHCQEHGHPIVGDQKYGGTSNPIKRLCLHAASLTFVHPVTGKSLCFESPVPKSFDRLVKDTKGEHA